LLIVQKEGNHGDEKLLRELIKRKLVEKKYVQPLSQLSGSLISILTLRCLFAYRKTFYYSVEKGSQFSTTVQKLETDLTVELLNSYVLLSTSADLNTRLKLVRLNSQRSVGESFVQEIQL